MSMAPGESRIWTCPNPIGDVGGSGPLTTSQTLNPPRRTEYADPFPNATGDNMVGGVFGETAVGSVLPAT